VAGLSHRLPVFPVPEQRHITTVRGDVVDHLCWYRAQLASLAIRALAERVLAQVARARLLPSVAVAARARRFAPSVRILSSLDSVCRAAASVGQRSAPRPRARPQRNRGHGLRNLDSQSGKKARRRPAGMLKRLCKAHYSSRTAILMKWRPACHFVKFHALRSRDAPTQGGDGYRADGFARGKTSGPSGNAFGDERTADLVTGCSGAHDSLIVTCPRES
jgi:hypothetical protein